MKVIRCIKRKNLFPNLLPCKLIMDFWICWIVVLIRVIPSILSSFGLCFINSAFSIIRIWANLLLIDNRLYSKKLEELEFSTSDFIGYSRSHTGDSQSPPQYCKRKGSIPRRIFHNGMCFFTLPLILQFFQHSSCRDRLNIS